MLGHTRDTPVPSTLYHHYTFLFTLPYSSHHLPGGGGIANAVRSWIAGLPPAGCAPAPDPAAAGGGMITGVPGAAAAAAAVASRSAA